MLLAPANTVHARAVLTWLWARSWSHTFSTSCAWCLLAGWCRLHACVEVKLTRKRDATRERSLGLNPGTQQEEAGLDLRQQVERDSTQAPIQMKGRATKVRVDAAHEEKAVDRSSAGADNVCVFNLRSLSWSPRRSADLEFRQLQYTFEADVSRPLFVCKFDAKDHLCGWGSWAVPMQARQLYNIYRIIHCGPICTEHAWPAWRAIV